MKRVMKDSINEAFFAPAPVGKKDFFRNIRQPKISNIEFIFKQATYIQKWVWFISIFIFGTAIIGFRYFNKDILWIISSLVPLLALTLITESVRSVVYGMEELEMASRFSLKSILLARMGVLGVSNLVVLCLIAPLCNINNAITIIQTAIYMIIPYLLTTFLGLKIVRKLHNKDSIYVCAGVAILVSMLNIILKISFDFFYQKTFFHWWFIAAISLLVLTIWEFYKTIKQTEEYVWNY